MKVQIVKYLNSRGKVVEMRKDNFKGNDLPENIIEEYEIEIKDSSTGIDEIDELEDLKRKYATGNYILLWKGGRDVFGPPKWQICYDFGLHQFYDFKLIHNKHKDILEAYLKNPSVEIECTNYISKDADIETIWYPEENFIENYDENVYYRLKVKDLTWYEDENIISKLIYDGLNMEYGLVLKVRDNLIETSLDRKYSLNEINSYKLRPATEEEALNLVYKPEQKISKKTTSDESNRLKDLFLNNKAECLVENEQGFRLVYDFLYKICDKSLNRYLELDPRVKYFGFPDKFPIVIYTLRRWGNIFEYTKLKNRDKNKPLIKFDGEEFWEVFE